MPDLIKERLKVKKREIRANTYTSYLSSGIAKSVSSQILENLDFI